MRHPDSVGIEQIRWPSSRLSRTRVGSSLEKNHAGIGALDKAAGNNCSGSSVSDNQNVSLHVRIETTTSLSIFPAA